MSGHRKTALVGLAAASLGCSIWLSPTAFAGETSAWNGPYLLTFSANQKTGSSPAARNPEHAERASYTFASDCSTGVCVATVTDAATSTNQYAWNGSQWVQQTNWKLDCPVAGGAVEHDPARSTTALTPGPNGTLTGIFHSDILSGACKGTIDMPVSATPVSPPVV
jgi:hypothetical protein